MSLPWGVNSKATSTSQSFHNTSESGTVQDNVGAYSVQVGLGVDSIAIHYCP